MDKLLELLRYNPQEPLVFNSGLFLLLFLAFLAIYQIMRRWRVAKMLLVIAFSLYFYYKSSAEYCFILLSVCVTDYVLGRWLDGVKNNAGRRLIVAANVLINIGMLVYFKYISLLVDTIRQFATVEFDATDIILPAGISFFTFRSISYIVDIYRREMPACRDFLSYCFFLTFFPPLLAGPVVRAKDMLPQVEANPVATRAMVSEGLFLIMCGLVKKVIVADYLSQNFVDRIFDNPTLYSGFENLMGVYGFTLQLYCDFSGYTDMAIGIALLLGYRFLDNFRSPFKSQNPTEFWHRWHISLSTWLRDYVYIPMGGNRKGKMRRNLNLMTTMIVGGLWHGASWMYLIWGAMHGVFLVGHKSIKALMPKKDVSDESEPPRRTPAWRAVLNVFITFNLIAFAFVFFRADSLSKVTDIATQITTSFHANVIRQFAESYLLITLVIIGGFLMHFAPQRWTRSLKGLYSATPLILQAFVLAVVIFLIIQVRSSDIIPFIYLQY